MFQLFSNIVKNIEVDVFFKNRIVKNWKTLHREKHRIVKKREHRPPLISWTNDGLADQIFPRSAQSNFIHKSFRWGKLQLTLGRNQNFESKRNVPLDTSSPLAAEIRL